MKRFLTSLLMLASVNGLMYGAGQSPEKSPESIAYSYDMEEMVVTATRTPLQLKDTPVITRVITAKELERRGVVTIQEALEGELAGVEFHQAGYGSSLSFQGLDARYVLFLIDGERMAGETYGNVDYARLSMDNIERIEIVRGASSVLYGSNAMGAVVNIITRMPQDRVEVRASMRYGTPFQKNDDDETLGGINTENDIRKYQDKLDLPNMKGDISVGFNLGKFKSQTNFSYRSVDGYKLVGKEDEVRHYDALQMMGPKMIFNPGQPPRPEMDPSTGMPVFEVKHVVNDTTIRVGPDQRGLSVSGWSDFNIGQRFDYEISEKFRFQLSGNYFDKKRYDFNGSILDDNPMSNNSKPWTYETYRGYNIKALMEHSPNENNKIYLSYIRDGYHRYLDSMSGARIKKQRHTYNMPRLLWTLKAGAYNRLTTGVEFINEQLNFDLNPLGFEDKKSMNTVSAYVQDEITTNLPLSFVVGVRGDWNNRFGWSITPKASVKYTYKDFSLRANYANGYRMPSLKEMYMDFTIPISGQTSVIMGNDKLKSENNHYISLSAEYTRSNAWDLSATVYGSFFRNKIDVLGRTEGTETILQYDNIKSSKYAGVEVSGRVRVIRDLYLKGNYNYIFQTDDAPESSTQYIFPSPHTATFQANYGFTVKEFDFGINALVKYIGAKDYEEFMPVIKYDNPSSQMPSAYYTGNYSAHHKGYAVCNAAISAQWRQMLTLTIGVDNIFRHQPKIVNFNSAITAPRNMFVRLAYAFNSNGR